MLRRLTIALCAASLLAGIIVGAWLVRSLLVAGIVTKGRAVDAQDQSWDTLGVWKGELLFNHTHMDISGPDRRLGRVRGPMGPLRVVKFSPYLRVAGDLPHHFLGFGWSADHVVLGNPDGNALNKDYVSIALPLWAAVLLLVAPPLVVLTRLWKTRHPGGHCFSCGYDLRASTERCPECGMPILKSTGATA